MLKRSVHVLVEVNESVLVLVSCDEESAQLFLGDLDEDLTHLGGVDIAVLVVVEGDEVILVLLLRCFLVFTIEMLCIYGYYTAPREPSPTKSAAAVKIILIYYYYNMNKED